MSKVVSDRKRIAQNSFFLYIRTFIVVVISLLNYRVILQVLGLQDYGIYSAVGGLVGIMAFLKAALGTAASRFFSFEIGKGDSGRLNIMFSSLLSTHIILAILIVFFCETFGLWFVSTNLIIPADRYDAALICFQFSLVSCFFDVIKVPYIASVLSHEDMKIYSMVSILEVLLKFTILFIIACSSIDKLVLFVALEMLVSFGVLFFYVLYCKHRYSECHYTLLFDFVVLKDIFIYTIWNLLSNISNTLKNNGGVVLLNMFFNPSIVASYSIASSANNFASQFIGNIRTATSPLIVKRYAAGDGYGSKSLTLKSTQITYYMILLVCLPLIFVAEPVIKIWLGNVPPYSVAFFKIAIVTGIIGVYNSCFYSAIYAKGQIKENAITVSILSLMVLPVSYLLFKYHFSPISLAGVSLIVTCLLSFVQKPLVLHYIAGYKWQDIISCFCNTLKVTLFALLIPVLFFYFSDYIVGANIYKTFFLMGISFVCTVISIWGLGLDHEMRFLILRRLHLINETNSSNL